jgi:hypothetical protein
MMAKLLEDLVDVRAIVEKAARQLCQSWPWDEPVKLRDMEDLMRCVTPEFALRRERNQRIWADVMSAQTGLEADVLMRLYGEYLRERDEMDEEFARAPLRGRVYYRQPGGEQEKNVAKSVDPTELVLLCRDLEAAGARQAWFEIYGQGRVVVGHRQGWFAGCAHRQALCAWHGEPRRNRPEWYKIYDPQIWPWVGVVPGSEWHPVR